MQGLLQMLPCHNQSCSEEMVPALWIKHPYYRAEEGKVGMTAGRQMPVEGDEEEREGRC